MAEQIRSRKGRRLTVLGDPALLTMDRSEQFRDRIDTDPRIASLSLVAGPGRGGWLRSAAPAGVLVAVADDVQDLVGAVDVDDAATWPAWFRAASERGLWHDWLVTSNEDLVGIKALLAMSETDAVESRDLSGSHGPTLEPRAIAERLTVSVDGSWLGPIESGAQVMTVAAIDALARREDVAEIRVVGIGELPDYAQHLREHSNVRVLTSDMDPPLSDVIWYPHQIYSNTEIFGQTRSLAHRTVVTYLDFISYDIPTYHASQLAQLSYRALQRRIALVADAITTISGDVASRLLDDVPGIDARRVQATLLGLDHVSDEVSLSELPRGGLLTAQIFLNRYGEGAVDRPFILVLGNSYLHKNREFAVKVWRDVGASGIDCDLIMAGATVAGAAGDALAVGQESRNLNDHGHGDLYVVDWNVDSATRLWLLANAAAVLYPTSSEGFGLPPYEAAAFGTPTTFTNFGPLREVSQASNLPAHWSVEEYAKDLIALLTDPKAARRRVEDLQQAVSRHTWDGFAEELMALFAQVVQLPVATAGALGGRSDVVTQAVAALLRPSPPGQVGSHVVISVVVPVGDTQVDHLWQCLDSMVTQTSKSWELIVVLTSTATEEQAAVVGAFADRYGDDPRVVVKERRDAGTTDALNRGIRAASGDYVGFLDPEDLLDPRCIEEFGLAVANWPDAAYCDEDKVFEWGLYGDPFFKPDFSPELLLTQMYLCHFAVFRRNLVLEVGGFRQGCEWAQDYDLVLRLLPRLDQVAHIPKVLYHWRSDSTVVNLGLDVERSAQEADARVQRDYLERTFGGGEVVASSTPGINRVHPRIDESTRVSVILPTIGKDDGAGGRLVDTAVRSLMESETRLSLEFIIITAGGMEDVRVDDFHGHTLRHVDYQAEEFNFAEKINLGCSVATGEYLLLLNDDTEVVSQDPVSKMLEIAQIPEVAVTGCLLTFPDGRLQHAGIIMTADGPYHCWSHCASDDPGYFGSTLMPRNFSAVTASVVLIRTSVFRKLGGYDTQYPITYNDIDFCLRAIESGHRVAWTPYAHWTHFENASLQRTGNPVGQELFDIRWRDKSRVDPFYSPNLNQRASRLFEVR